MWFAVSAANDTQPITDATFSAPFSSTDAAGAYYVDIGVFNDFWVSAPHYQTVYSTTPGEPGIEYPGGGWICVALTYTGGWPQTY